MENTGQEPTVQSCTDTVLTETNQLKLYRVLGPEKAPYASPKMFEGGEVKWYSYLGESKGQEGRPSPLPSMDLREQRTDACALADIFDR